MGSFSGALRLATPEDAAALVEAVQRCYGSSYISPETLVADRVAAEIAEGRALYVLASDERGEHIGQGALVQLGPGLWECGRVIVELPCRSAGVCNAINDFLLAQAPRLGARFVLGRMVTSHVFMQHYGLSRGFVPTGLLLGIAPRTFTAAGISIPTQAISMVVAVRRCEVGPRPRALTLVGRDLALATDVLTRLAVPTVQGVLAGRSRTLGARLEWLPSLGISQLRFGGDGPHASLPRLLARADSHDPRVIWADVPAEEPGAPGLADELRAAGFGWGAYIPLGGPEGEDVVRFQRVMPRERLSLERIEVLEALRPLRDDIFADASLSEAVCQ